ncbi:AraC family transcriptional regulator [Puia dinghuensis]|uniref:AraC family transcriptional regulator n=1 Tax=Puia dinghuensis TaxID=1792502 RepID=A0A8J2XS38_9BACT|nr:helix-turn-helix domain-containing protein [Puia dinghuensis]GGA89323.1 AraC family transcriptional regulator [Puia dinghuensis]
MKPKLLKVPRTATHSFSVREDRDPFINNRWHYHAEVELIVFHQGSGTQFVGDHIKRFQPGDIILVGSNLPHYWRYDDIHFKEAGSQPVHSTVIHFSENFWGDAFLELPETKPIRSLLDKARRGILVSARDEEKIPALVRKINSSEGVGRIIALIECLSAFAGSDRLQLLSSIGFRPDYAESENDRINAIYDYTFRHFTGKIYLGEVAAVAGLVPNSFCRYFKSRTGKTYTQFLTEIRIGHACKLLLDNRVSIKQLCYESGFNNFTCFHKNFRLITGKSPQSYQREHGIA